MYVRLDKIKSNAHLESIIADVDLVNGQFVALGALEADGEARKVTPSGDVTKKLVFHASVPLTYWERQNELDFVLEKGKVGRGFVLEEGDVISIEKKGVSGAMAKGALVVPDANGFKVGTPAGLHGEIIAIDNDMYAGELAVIRISTK
ncbi:hypothetical protein [Bacillus sp. ISTL8]|uniref:hypothetical protein n=1 Tax=Bacillus sp. ISTL8 TaxID=2596896 RepID=UPI001456CFA5|nr:hypothetical protein [Bacillus sp. ISTL8]